MRKVEHHWFLDYGGRFLQVIQYILETYQRLWRTDSNHCLKSIVSPHQPPPQLFPFSKLDQKYRPSPNPPEVSRTDSGLLASCWADWRSCGGCCAFSNKDFSSTGYVYFWNTREVCSQLLPSNLSLSIVSFLNLVFFPGCALASNDSSLTLSWNFLSVFLCL